jgi:hypothetical protein
MGNMNSRTQRNHEMDVLSGISAAELGRAAEHDVLDHVLSTRSRSVVVISLECPCWLTQGRCKTKLDY